MDATLYPAAPEPVTTYELELRWQNPDSTAGPELVATRTFGQRAGSAFAAAHAWVQRGELDGIETAKALDNRTAVVYRREPIATITEGS